MCYSGEAVEGRRSKGAINEEGVMVTDKCCGLPTKSQLCGTDSGELIVGNWILGNGSNQDLPNEITPTA